MSAVRLALEGDRLDRALNRAMARRRLLGVERPCGRRIGRPWWHAPTKGQRRRSASRRRGGRW
jgi:hypothetical protein